MTPAVARVVQQLERMGSGLAAETLRAYDRARVELRARMVDHQNADQPLQASHVAAIIGQVDSRLEALAHELGARYGQAFGEAAVKAVASGVADLEAMVPKATIERLALSGHLAPKVPHEVVELMVQDAGSLIKGVNDTLRTAIRRELTAGVIRGASTKELARVVMGTGVGLDGIKPVFPSVLSRAECIARTEVSRAFNAVKLNTFTQMQAGVKGLKMRWLAAPCRKDCDFCHKTLNGQVRAPGEQFEGGGKRFASPPAHPRCKCVLVGHVAESVGELEGEDELAAAIAAKKNPPTPPPVTPPPPPTPPEPPPPVVTPPTPPAPRVSPYGSAQLDYHLAEPARAYGLLASKGEVSELHARQVVIDHSQVERLARSVRKEAASGVHSGDALEDAVLRRVFGKGGDDVEAHQLRLAGLLIDNGGDVEKLLAGKHTYQETMQALGYSQGHAEGLQLEGLAMEGRALAAYDKKYGGRPTPTLVVEPPPVVTPPAPLKLSFVDLDAADQARLAKLAAAAVDRAGVAEFLAAHPDVTLEFKHASLAGQGRTVAQAHAAPRTEGTKGTPTTITIHIDPAGGSPSLGMDPAGGSLGLGSLARVAKTADEFLERTIVGELGQALRIQHEREHTKGPATSAAFSRAFSAYKQEIKTDFKAGLSVAAGLNSDLFVREAFLAAVYNPERLGDAAKAAVAALTEVRTGVKAPAVPKAPKAPTVPKSAVAKAVAAAVKSAGGVQKMDSLGAEAVGKVIHAEALARFAKKHPDWVLDPGEAKRKRDRLYMGPLTLQQEVEAEKQADRIGHANAFLHRAATKKMMAEVYLEVLADIRPMAKEASNVTLATASQLSAMDARVKDRTHRLATADELRFVREAGRHFPQAWEDASVKAGRIELTGSQRGYYLNASSRAAWLSLSGGSEVSIRSTAVHELGHRAESNNSRIRELEQDYYLRVTKGEAVKALGYSKPPDEEWYRRDNFHEDYTGRDYSYAKDGRASFYEILTTGLEGLFGDRDYMGLETTNPNESFRNFVLGLLGAV